MHKLKRIEIGGFRGQTKVISLSMYEDANFLIGKNGTGKTTLINIINAGLTANISALRELPFQYIDFQFKKAGKRALPKVRIENILDGEQGASIKYRIYDDSKSSSEDFLFGSNRRRASLLDIPVILGRFGGEHPSSTIFMLKKRLSAIYKTSWLSLKRRADVSDGSSDDKVHDDRRSDVDHKIDQLSNEIVKYFSRLDRQVSDQTQLFQKNWFLSFLATERSFVGLEIDDVNLDDERKALSAIFDKFNMSKESYSSQLEKHLKLATRVKEQLQNQQSVRFNDYFILFDIIRLHTLVEQWGKLQEGQKTIYAPKNEYISTISEMLFRKNVIVNRSNQICIETSNGDPIPLTSLSSGEKQLLIFFSETLLQEQLPYIFLADEPELSLHVEWQEELVPNILKINQNAQILFATHSPDVVNVYQKQLIRMEHLID